MDDTNHMRSRTFVLLAGIETDLLFDSSGMETDTASSLEMIIQNAGAQAVGVITRYQTVDGVTSQDPANYGPIAAGATKTLPFSPIYDDVTRVTGTSIAGTTLIVSARAIQR